ncbi:MAG: cysteine--tRNA ligase [Oscillospiraceae bacterium]|jgi:cysteinyl-tRNA synthetase|nr:cysteine--tRNA ligase [Oscillospiraceae bacterium]
MKLYNTLTRQKEEFVPADGRTAGIYACGPTVYSPAHIGNMRTYLFVDWLRRALKFEGYAVKHVMNVTDVGHLTDDADGGEDKVVKESRERKTDPWEIARAVTERFFADIDELNVERPEIVCKATGHIPQMIAFTGALMQKGHAYETPDGIYFDISTFPGYGRLSGLDLEAQQAGARVEVNPYKRHSADFALWKKAPREHIMQWESPWGMGYPGWHIECSAMGLQYLGERFDIHTGGVDHIPVHHENEIAQSEALLGHPAVRFWMHGEFLLIDGGKMSKSLGNLYTLADLAERGYSPAHFRYFCAGAHYRNKLNFTWEGIDAAKTSYDRLLAAVRAHRDGTDAVSAEPYLTQMREAAGDDLNIPKAVGALWSMVRQPGRSQAVYDAVMEIDRVLGLRLDSAPQAAEERTTDTVPPDVQALVETRQAAKAAKNYAEADRIRDELRAMGYELTDTKEGVQCRKV